MNSPRPKTPNNTQCPPGLCDSDQIWRDMHPDITLSKPSLGNVDADEPKRILPDPFDDNGNIIRKIKLPNLDPIKRTRTVRAKTKRKYPPGKNYDNYLDPDDIQYVRVGDWKVLKPPNECDCPVAWTCSRRDEIDWPPGDDSVPDMQVFDANKYQLKPKPYYPSMEIMSIYNTCTRPCANSKGYY